MCVHVCVCVWMVGGGGDGWYVCVGDGDDNVCMCVCKCKCHGECKIYLSHLWREKMLCVTVLLNQGRKSVQIYSVSGSRV